MANSMYRRVKPICHGCGKRCGSRDGYTLENGLHYCARCYHTHGLDQPTAICPVCFHEVPEEQIVRHPDGTVWSCLACMRQADRDSTVAAWLDGKINANG